VASLGRALAKGGALFLDRLIEPLLPKIGRSFAGGTLKWDGAKLYFEGLEDPFKVFEFNVPDGSGGTKRISQSTAGLLKIEQASLEQARNTLIAEIQGLIDAGIVTEQNPWEGAGTSPVPNGYAHLKDPGSLLSAYPFQNDVYMPDITRKIEGMAIPVKCSPMFLTPRAFDPNVFPSDRMFAVSGALLTAIKMVHNACNANAAMSPAVNIALNRLGYTDTFFAAMDAQAAMNVVPKRTGIPALEANRGAWADNRFFGDPNAQANAIYSNKNSYLPQLGALDQTSIQDIRRDGPQSSASTNFINPAFPEWFRPIHFADIAPAGSRPDAGFTLYGQTDPIYRASADRRRPLFTFSDVFETDGNTLGVPGGVFRQDSWIGSMMFNVHMSYFNRGEYGDPNVAIRRLRDWYLTNKVKCDVRMADAITDFAALVQLARFIAYVPPHVLLHSVMGYHNALLKMSFEYCDVPYSTSIVEYQNKMRTERAGIAALSQDARYQNLSNSNDLGYALTVKPPDSVILADESLRDATVASLSLAAAACAINPYAGLACFAIVGCAILVAEVTGNKAQPLITPRDKSRETLRDKRDGGIRSNWFRGVTPEYVINTVPVVRV